jgi:hypothetical protein
MLERLALAELEKVFRYKAKAVSGLSRRQFILTSVVASVCKTRRMKHAGLWRMFHAKQDPAQD